MRSSCVTKLDRREGTSSHGTVDFPNGEVGSSNRKDLTVFDERFKCFLATLPLKTNNDFQRFFFINL